MFKLIKKPAIYQFLSNLSCTETFYINLYGIRTEKNVIVILQPSFFKPENIVFIIIILLIVFLSYTVE